MAKKKAPTRRRRDTLAGERTTSRPAIEKAGPGDAGHAFEIPEGESAIYYRDPSKPHPEAYTVPEPVPCRSCERVLTTHALRAVQCYGIKGGTVAYMRCRVCEHEWKLPVRRA